MSEQNRNYIEAVTGKPTGKQHIRVNFTEKFPFSYNGINYSTQAINIRVSHLKDICDELRRYNGETIPEGIEIDLPIEEVRKFIETRIKKQMEKISKNQERDEDINRGIAKELGLDKD